jgi:hypothetical protein
MSSIAVLLLLALISLPFWLRGHQNTVERTAEKPNKTVVDMPSRAHGPASRLPNLSLVALELPKITLLDAGWITEGSTMQQIVHPSSVLRWVPAQSAVDWRLETGPITGSYVDDEGRLYLMEKYDLTILNTQSGEVLSRHQLKNIPASISNAGLPVPIGRQGKLLYLRNNATRDNLFTYDLQTGMFGEEHWTLSERGYPFDSVYLPQKNEFVTFCIDFATGTQGILIRLSMENRTSASVEVPVLGADEYMVGNGFALGPADTAYVVDSDAGALVEIDLDSMQILRQANYRQAGMGKGLVSRTISWLFNLAASPARAKRWMSQPAVSPNGSHLVVDGGFGIGGGVTTSAWLIGLENLVPVKEIKLPSSPQAFHFTNNNLLYILLETEMPGGSQVLVYDLISQGSQILDLPSPGRVLQMFP